MKDFKYILILFISSISLFANNLKQTEEFYKKPLPELLKTETELKADVASRSGDRDILLSEVPIDVITSEQIMQSGTSELSQILQRFIPGFNFPRPSVTDGSDHTRPFTLRGLNPDQVLVLINGKRLHQSSLMNINGTIGRGTSSVDLNTIPIAAIDKVEVLRDGAAAQYGSDAIAGVINIILKGYGYKSKASATYGETKEKDGALKRTDLFYSIPLDYDGFFNITAEYRDRGATNRAGPDTREQYPTGDPRNDLPSSVNMIYGDADTQDKLLAINSEVIAKSGLVFYYSGLYNSRDSEAGAFVRRPQDSRNNTNIYPDGFLPMIAPEIEDYSFTLGTKNILNNGIKFDLSYTNGFNDFHFFVNNSHNDSLGDDSPTSFDSGGTSYRQQIINLDLSKKIDSLFLAAGIELKNENYEIYKGEEASYVLGTFSSSAGAQGFPGFQPTNEVNEDRNSVATYLDTRYNYSKNTTFGLASRFENYSDFGSTFNNKLYFTHKPIDSIFLRATTSTGFRAPSLSQSYYTSTTTQVSGTTTYQSGTFAVNHPVSKSLGAVDLKPEKSKHISAGFVYQPNSDFSFSADYFYVKIDDRIMLSSNIKEGVSDEVKTILNNYKVTSARYFTNAVNTKTDGVDLRLNYKNRFDNDSVLKTSLSYQYNSTKVKSINTAPSILGEDGQDIIVDSSTIISIENAQPKNSIKFYNQYSYNAYKVMLNLNRFGNFQSVLFGDTYEFDAKWTTDLEVSYKVNNSLHIAIGSENIFDVYPDKWKNTGSSITDEDKIFQYAQFSPFGYNGAFYYIRVGITF